MNKKLAKFSRKLSSFEEHLLRNDFFLRQIEPFPKLEYFRRLNSYHWNKPNYILYPDGRLSFLYHNWQLYIDTFKKRKKERKTK